MSLIEPAKPFWKSKTIWINALGILATLLNVIPPNETTVLVGGILNLILRTFTKKPVTANPSAVR